MCAGMPKLPLIEDLTTAPVPAGSYLLVEFDAASLWYNASYTISAGWLRQGGKIAYSVYTQPPDDLRSKLRRLGLEVEALENENRLRIVDRYTVTLGQKSKEKYAVDSLKVVDLSLQYSKEVMRESPDPSWLRIADSHSNLARFNDDKSWTEFLLTRSYPAQKLRKSTTLGGLTNSLHSDWVYRKLEAGADGIIDFKLDETSDPPRNRIRIRSMRDVGFDARWHSLKTGDNYEVILSE